MQRIKSNNPDWGRLFSPVCGFLLVIIPFNTAVLALIVKWGYKSDYIEKPSEALKFFFFLAVPIAQVIKSYVEVIMIFMFRLSPLYASFSSIFWLGIWLMQLLLWDWCNDIDDYGGPSSPRSDKCPHPQEYDDGQRSVSRAALVYTLFGLQGVYFIMSVVAAVRSRKRRRSGQTTRLTSKRSDSPWNIKASATHIEEGRQ